MCVRLLVCFFICLFVCDQTGRRTGKKTRQNNPVVSCFYYSLNRSCKDPNFCLYVAFVYICSCKNFSFSFPNSNLIRWFSFMIRSKHSSMCFHCSLFVHVPENEPEYDPICPRRGVPWIYSWKVIVWVSSLLEKAGVSTVKCFSVSNWQWWMGSYLQAEHPAVNVSRFH